MDTAADLDEPIPYMARTRAYYGALGYPPYRWAHFDDVPFAPLVKPLGETRVALITTAAPYQPDKGDQGPVQTWVSPTSRMIATTRAQMILIPTSRSLP
jgi:D-proline reductase (dithiol) PrdB